MTRPVRCTGPAEDFEEEGGRFFGLRRRWGGHWVVRGAPGKGTCWFVRMPNVLRL